jgi:hypothetical protein
MDQHMVRDFGVLLSQLSGGELRDEVNEEVARVMATLYERALATQQTAKGKVTLEMSFEVAKNGLTTILGDVKTKLPTPLREADHFYTDAEGGFSKSDPRQMKLPIREVPAALDEPVREVEFDPETGDVKETTHV